MPGWARAPHSHFIAFILMQLAFGAAGSAGLLAFEILGFVLFVLFLASAATTLVGIIGMLLRLAGRERARRNSNPNLLILRHGRAA